MNIFKFGDNVDTDAIIPARYLVRADSETLRAHCMEELDPGFAGAVRPGDVVVAGENFGCGSSREHAPLALKACGVSAVVAKSFARIFYRNAINIGLPILVCPEAADALEAGDDVALNLVTGEIVRGVNVYSAQPLPEFIRAIVDAGGLLNAVKAGLLS